MFAMNDRTVTKPSTASGMMASGAQTIGRSMTAQNTPMMTNAAMTFTHIGQASRSFTLPTVAQGCKHGDV